MNLTVCDGCGDSCAGRTTSLRLERGEYGTVTLGERPGPWDFCSLACLVKWAQR